MDVLEAGRNVFGLVGIVSVAYLLIKALRWKLMGDDAPIRVKGGSVEVTNEVADWELDDEEDEPEYHYKGRTRGFNVQAWESELDWEAKLDPVFTSDGRTVVVDIAGTSNKLKFKANGGVRVIDKKGAFSSSGTKLEDISSNHWPEKIIVKLKRKEVGNYPFKGKAGYIRLTPTKK